MLSEWNSYAFCRSADDLVDDSADLQRARYWVAQLKQYLHIRYSLKSRDSPEPLSTFITTVFPTSVHAPLKLLPTTYLPPQPLYDLLNGFEIDLDFGSASNPFPIKDELDLQRYAKCVAGTVGELFTVLVFHHVPSDLNQARKKAIVESSVRMGIALQYVNIARDVGRDAQMGRIYLPLSWLQEQNLTTGDVLQNPNSSKTEALKRRLVEKALQTYHDARSAIEELPLEVRGPTRVAIENYMEIGRVLQSSQYRVEANKATVPWYRRLKVAWVALNTPYDI